MPNDLTLTTRGLPAPGSATCVDRTFEWFFAGDTLTIPKSQCGQTDFIARDSAQAAWLAERGPEWLHGVWDCVWAWNTPGARDDFMAVLAPLDPQGDKVTRALRKLDRPNAAGRVKAATTLLALDRPNLAAAVPALERTLRDADPELRALATALLHGWHRRTDPARLASLFRDDDPVVREAALQQAQLECQRDPSAGDRLPFILERMADGDPSVRHQALEALQAAVVKGLVTSRRVLQLRADLGPLVDGDGVDRSDMLCRLADSRGPRAPSAPAMQAFHAALCEVELLRAQVDKAAERARATERARTLWDRLLLDAPEEVRLHDARVDVLLRAGPSSCPQDADLVRRIVNSRSPRRELDAAAIDWLYQHTAPRGFPADSVRREPTKAQVAEKVEDAAMDENMRSFLRHFD